MSSNPELAFSEPEERHLLAEILKQSQISPSLLVKFVSDVAIQPAWHEIAAPWGRSITQCQHAFQALMERYVPVQLPLPMPRQAKRSLTTTTTTTTEPYVPAARELQPKPPAFQSVNAPEQYSPSSAGEPAAKKKRGRPSKEEQERRRQHAAERGEVYPKPRRKTQTPRLSMDGVEQTGLAESSAAAVATAALAATAASASAAPRAGSSPIPATFTPKQTVLALPSQSPANRDTWQQQQHDPLPAANSPMQQIQFHPVNQPSLENHKERRAGSSSLELNASDAVALAPSKPLRSVFGPDTGSRIETPSTSSSVSGPSGSLHPSAESRPRTLSGESGAHPLSDLLSPSTPPQAHRPREVHELHFNPINARPQSEQQQQQHQQHLLQQQHQQHQNEKQQHHEQDHAMNDSLM